MKKTVARKFPKITGKHLRRSLFNKYQAGCQHFVKVRPWHGCFPVNFAKFLRILWLCYKLIREFSFFSIFYTEVTVRSCPIRQLR